MKIFGFLMLLKFLKSSEANKNDDLVCNLRIMNSYLLHGRKEGSDDPNYVCTNIEKNCCTKID